MRALWTKVENHGFCVFKVSIFGENDIFKMCKTRFAPAVLNTFFHEWSINQYFNKNNNSIITPISPPNTHPALLSLLGTVAYPPP